MADNIEKDDLFTFASKHCAVHTLTAFLKHCAEVNRAQAPC